jgi:glycerol-3-phosphate dehydrogenase
VTEKYYDVVVVGGGINGVGVAQAAAAAGYSVLVLEKQALAAGTSSKSSKLIHGGLRYLESYEFALVREGLRERALLLKLAPELVKLQDFYVPLYGDTRRKPWLLRTGLSLYYILSGCDRHARFATVPRSGWDQLDGLRTDDLRAVFRFADARTNDALLTEAVMRSAESLGAELACPARFAGAEIGSDRVAVRYKTGDWQRSCDAGVLVNAAGPWVNDVSAAISPAMSIVPVDLVQGAHIVVAGEMQERFYYIESPRDGRAIYVMPRDGAIMVGTTETRYHGDPDEVHALVSEESYLLRILGHYFPQFRELTRNDLLASWAGCRVLPAGKGHAFHKSRETILHPDHPERPRVLSIYGGKLTSYRATAEKVIARVADSLPPAKRVASTAELPLSLA